MAAEDGMLEERIMVEQEEGIAMEGSTMMAVAV